MDEFNHFFVVRRLNGGGASVKPQSSSEGAKSHDVHQPQGLRYSAPEKLPSHCSVIHQVRVFLLTFGGVCRFRIWNRAILSSQNVTDSHGNIGTKRQAPRWSGAVLNSYTRPTETVPCICWFENSSCKKRWKFETHRGRPNVHSNLQKVSVVDACWRWQSQWEAFQAPSELRCQAFG